MTPLETWIWIPNWDGPDGFQHYKGRDPIWIKNYTRLLSHDSYRSLTYHQRGVLHGIWLAYATSPRHHGDRHATDTRQTRDRSSTAPRQLGGSTLKLTRQLGHRVLTRDLEALTHAGFIEILDSTTLAERLQDASKTLALTRARALAREEKRREEEELGVVLDNGGVRPSHVWQETDKPPDLTYITKGMP